MKHYRQITLRKLAVLVGLSLVTLAPAAAQKVGTTSMQFLKLTPTARASAMGSAYVALAEGAEAVYWNPARIVGATSHEVALDRVDWFMDVTHTALAYVINFDNVGSFGVHFYTANVGDIEETRVDQLGFVPGAGGQVYNPGLTGSTFSPTSWVVGISYARKMTDRFSAGITAKYAREDLYLATAGVPLFDFGISYDTNFRSLQLGASVANFGPPVKFVTDSYPAPMLFRIGVAANLIGAESVASLMSDVNRLTATYELKQPNDYDQQWAAGLEYAFVERFFLRGGYQFNYDLESFSFGAGLRQPIGRFGLLIDYAYGDMGAHFQSVQRFSFRLLFE